MDGLAAEWLVVCTSTLCLWFAFSCAIRKRTVGRPVVDLVFYFKSKAPATKWCCYADSSSCGTAYRRLICFMVAGICSLRDIKLPTVRLEWR